MEIKKKKIKDKIKLRIQLDLKKIQTQSHVHSKVYFPYKPYDQQIKIINTLHQAIENHQNALIESPTGTGKTLCLLVGSLSFFSNKN